MSMIFRVGAGIKENYHQKGFELTWLDIFQ